MLTSGRTFSAAEQFAYNLRQLGRATLVGEPTGGGAHPRDVFRLIPHLEVNIPTGRAIKPLSGTNWEGTGVTPDIAAAADEALPVAHRHALERVQATIDAAAGEPDRVLAAEVREALARLGATVDGDRGPDRESS